MNLDKLQNKLKFYIDTITLRHDNFLLAYALVTTDSLDQCWTAFLTPWATEETIHDPNTAAVDSKATTKMYLKLLTEL